MLLKDGPPAAFLSLLAAEDVMRGRHPIRTVFFQYVIAPPLGVAYFLVSRTLWLLIGWWRGPQLARRQERQFAEEIRTTLPFLFDEWAGKIVPNVGIRFPPPFDYAVVTVAVHNFLLRFIRGRDEFRVDVAPKTDPKNWQEVSMVLTAIGALQGYALRLEYYRLADFGRLMYPRMADLNAAMSEEKVASTHENLSPLLVRNERRRQQMEIEINRKLYGS